MEIDPTKIVQLEIPVAKLDEALTFYREVFGWKPTPGEIHNYAIMEVPKDCGIGLSIVGGSQPKQAPHGPVVYFRHDDPEQIVEKVIANGGKKIFGPKPIPPVGQIFQIADPDGNKIGLFTKSI